MSGTISSTLINSINFVNNNFTLFFIGARHLQEFSKDWSPGGSQQSFILGGSAPKSNPPYPEKVPLCIPSVGNGTPFTCLELCIPLNCCKSTVFKIWINHKTRPFTQLFSQPCNAFVSTFWAFLPTEMTVSLSFHILQQVKSQPSHILKAWKWYPFWVEPLRIGHFREYPSGFKSALNFDQQYVQFKQVK